MRAEVKTKDTPQRLYEDSFSLNSRLSNRVSTAEFDIEGESYSVSDAPSLAIALVPALGGYSRIHTRNEVIIDRGMTPSFSNCAIVLTAAMGGRATYLNHFFGGHIAIVDVIRRGLHRVYRCSAQDYNSRLNHILIDESYSNKTEAEIITDLFDTYWPEIDTSTYVVGDNTVASIQFPDIYLGDALDQLAQMFGRERFIDYQKKLHYFTPTTGEAPFELSDQPALTTKLPFEMMEYSEDASRLINRVLVKGDGVEVTRTDDDSYDLYGEWYDYLHSDNNINTTAWAELVGDAILAESAFEKVSARLKLWQEGLVIGQKVKITDRARKLDGYYLIQSLKLRMVAGLQEEVVIEVGGYSRDLIAILAAINKLEQGGASGGGGG